MESPEEANLRTTPGEASCHEHDRIGRLFREFLLIDEVVEEATEALPLSIKLLGNDGTAKDSSLPGLFNTQIVEVVNISSTKGQEKERKKARKGNIR